MEELRITGGKPLRGQLRIQGAKNAILPVLAASLLSTEPIVLNDAPPLVDVCNMLKIMEDLGCVICHNGMQIQINPQNAHEHRVSESLAHEMRSSIFLLGPILSRHGKAVFTYPGGCDIGLRPIDLHLKGLRALGVFIEEKDGFIICNTDGLRGADVHLDYPSVGATENIIMAAAVSKGTTTIYNAAKEPEIVELQAFINAMGGCVTGAHTGIVTITGVNRLHGGAYAVMPDRIVAGTMMIAVAMTAGEALFSNIIENDIQPVIAALREMGCDITVKNQTLALRAPDRLKSFNVVKTQPHPGFPTDLQAPIMAAACVAEGTAVIIENIFENRFRHVAQLTRMGANVMVEGRTAIVRGTRQLNGAKVEAEDLRAGAALVLAGLCAKGETVVRGVPLIDRGYWKIEEQLTQLGADIKRKES